MGFFKTKIKGVEHRMKEIKLGYEVGTGTPIFIRPSHLIVTGITQLSGKTTTLEALIKRSGLKAIVFKTKIGEKSFNEGIEIPPFFRDRSDYEFVKSLIEAYSKEKLFIEKGTLMRLCKGSASLLEIKKKVDEALLGKLRSFEMEIHTRLQHYLENLIPQIQYANLSKTLLVHEGINIMNLERFSEEVQSLIIQSVSDEVLKTMNNVIIVIPEAWKFLPQKYNNPCKRSVEAFIRQGATNNNFIWIDSQDMAGVDKIPLKQISTWILGYQSERNEVKHTLDQISLPKKSKPTEDQIMTLKKGHFYLSSYDGVKSVYVQPSWLDNETTIKVALGEISIDELKQPENLVPFTRSIENNPEIRFDDSQIKKELIELRNDIFNKFQEHQIFLNKLSEKLFSIESNKVNTDEIISRVLQKIPVSLSTGNYNFDRESIIKEILERVPKSTNAVYQVAPIEKLKKDFLEEAKGRIVSEIQKLSDQLKKSLKFVEVKGTRCTKMEIYNNGLGYKGGYSGGGAFDVGINDMIKNEILRKDNSFIYPNLKNRIKKECENFGITEQEIQQVYDNILMEIIDDSK